jgi:diketogulonate reductase-like aldo/keto reductase
MKKLTTKNGKSIPPIGLGTFPFEGRVMANVVKSAVELGYRLIDTADDYRGESGIGLAIKEMQAEGDYKRGDLFIQTKISDNNAHVDEPLSGVFFNPKSKFMQRHTVEEIVREKVETSLSELGTNYLDSLLIHYPFPEYFVDIWKVMIELKKEGLVRYIGVSNFHERHIEMLIKETKEAPEINECYASPIGIKKRLIEYCDSCNCLFMTYSPLMDLASGRITEEPLTSMMAKYKKSAAQIILRWNIERGCMPLPKTQTPKRLKENFDVLDFSMDEKEVAYISSLNIDYQYLVESKICPGI